MNARHLVSGLLALTACTGEAIVGRHGFEDESACESIPACGTEDPDLGLTPLDPEPFSAFDACTPESPGAPCDDLRERACEEQHAQCERFMRGAEPTRGQLAGCSPEGRIRVEGSFALSILDVTCSDLAFDLGPDAELVFRDAQIFGTRFDVAGEPGSKIRFQRVVGMNVHVTLSEHAWLEVTDGSQFSRLTVVADPEMEGRVVTIRASEQRDLRVSSGPRTEVFLEECVAEAGAMDVGQLVLAGSDLRRVHARAGNLVASSGSLEADVLEIGTGYIDGTSMSDTQVERCASLAIVGSSIRRSSIAACETPLDVRGGMVLQSTLRGSTELTDADVLQSVFETGPGGTNTFVDARVERAVFCDTPAVVATTSRFECIDCDPTILSLTLEEMPASVEALCPPR